MQKKLKKTSKPKFIPWYQHEYYEGDVSFTGWIQTFNEPSLTAYAIVGWDKRNKSDPYWVEFVAKRISFVPIDGMGPIKKQALKHQVEGIKYAKRLVESIKKKGTWGDKSIERLLKANPKEVITV